MYQCTFAPTPSNPTQSERDKTNALCRIEKELERLQNTRWVFHRDSDMTVKAHKQSTSWVCFNTIRRDKCECIQWPSFIKVVQKRVFHVNTIQNWLK